MAEANAAEEAAEAAQAAEADPADAVAEALKQYSIVQENQWQAGEM